MSTIYRVDAYNTETSEHTSDFYARKHDAIRAFNRRAKVRASHITLVVEALEVPRTKDGLVAALNLAIGHPANWPGRVLRKLTGTAD